MVKVKDKIVVEYYTDPLCCWSWVLEPNLHQLTERYADQIECNYFMGGLVPEWQTYLDPIKGVSSPIEMGVLWKRVAKSSGFPSNNSIWLNNPPASSYPSCVAIKCAQLQSQNAAVKLLHYLRIALFEHGRNISRQSEIMKVANEMVIREDISFDLNQFDKDLMEGKGITELKEDLKLKEEKRIYRLPALIFKNMKGRGVILFGYRPYNVLEEIFLHVKDGISDKKSPITDRKKSKVTSLKFN